MSHHILHKHSCSSSSISSSISISSSSSSQQDLQWSAECGVHTQQDKAQNACSIDLPLHPAEAGTRPVQLALHLNRPCLSFYWPSTCNRLMTPLHTAHAKIYVAALMYACAPVIVLPALSVLHALKTNVQIMIMLQMGNASICVWQSMQVCAHVGASCCSILLERR